MSAWAIILIVIAVLVLTTVLLLVLLFSLRGLAGFSRELARPIEVLGCELEIACE